MNVNRSDTYITKQFLNFFTMIEILFHIQFSIHIGIMSIEVFATFCQCMYIFCTKDSVWDGACSIGAVRFLHAVCRIEVFTVGSEIQIISIHIIKGPFLHYIIITKSFSNFIKHTTFYFNMFSFSEWLISQVRQI